MEKKVELVKTISITPNLINYNIIKNVVSLLKLKYEKTCNENDGMITYIDNEDIKSIDNIIGKDSISVLFSIRFLATVVKPEKGNIINFKPTLILERGLFGKIYDNISVFIPESNMPGWKFEKDKFKKDNDIIDKSTFIKAMITDTKFNSTKYNCICTLIL